MSVTGWYCNSALISASNYWKENYEQYDVYSNPFGMFLLSGLQNMLANVISITNIYQSIDRNVALANETGIQYDLARLTRVLVIFPPIEPVDDDYTYVP